MSIAKDEKRDSSDHCNIWGLGWQAGSVVRSAPGRAGSDPDPFEDLQIGFIPFFRPQIV